MTDVLGYRAKLAVLGPSTNTVVEPDYYTMARRRVTAHYSRIYVADQSMRSDRDFERFLEQIRVSIHVAVRDALTCEPTALIMGHVVRNVLGRQQRQRRVYRAHHRMGGRAGGNDRADACSRALGMFGARRLGIVTPYQPVGDNQVRKYFTEVGYDIVALEGLKCPSAVSIC